MRTKLYLATMETPRQEMPQIDRHDSLTQGNENVRDKCVISSPLMNPIIKMSDQSDRGIG